MPSVHPSQGRRRGRPTRTASRTLDRTDDLVADHERKLRVGELAVHDVQVGAAHAAHVDTDEHLARSRLRLRQLSQRSRLEAPPTTSRARTEYTTTISVTRQAPLREQVRDGIRGLARERTAECAQRLAGRPRRG